jgi:hypothetical protein
MARKRGGLAGFYDRNKGWLKTAVPAALSFIPGAGIPLAAAAGAAMGGDVEGKGYFKGLKSAEGIGGAVKGGLSGYGIGKGTQAVAGGVRSLLAPKTPDISGVLGKTSGMLDEANAQILSKPAFGGAPTNYVQTFGGGLPASELEAMRQSARGGAARLAAPAMPSQPVMTMSQAPYTPAPIKIPGQELITSGNFPVQGKGPGIRDMLSGAGKFARENKDLIAMAGKGIGSMLPNAAGDAALMNAETNRMRLEAEQDQIKRDEERKRRIAALLMPYAQQQFPQYFGGQ